MCRVFFMVLVLLVSVPALAQGDTVTVAPDPQPVVVQVVPVPDPADDAAKVDGLVGTITATVSTLGAVLVGVVFVLVEILKGLWPGFATKSKAFKRSVAVLIGSGLGLAAAFVPELGLSWYVGLSAGFVASAVAILGRKIGKDGPARALMLALVVASGLVVAGCGTTFTAKTGETVTTQIKVGPPGQVVVKVADKVACTVNASENGRVKIENTCKAGTVPWYVGKVPTCIPNPCATGTLTHLEDGTTACR